MIMIVTSIPQPLWSFPAWCQPAERWQLCEHNGAFDIDVWRPVRDDGREFHRCHGCGASRFYATRGRYSLTGWRGLGDFTDVLSQRAMICTCSLDTLEKSKHHESSCPLWKMYVQDLDSMAAASKAGCPLDVDLSVIEARRPWVLVDA